MTPLIDDAIVVARVLAGERDLFAELVGRHQVALYRYAVAIVRDHDVAADMVQDVFVRAYTSLASCRDHARFHSWIFRMLRNRCLDHLRDPRRRNVPIDDAGELADPGPSPGAHIDRLRQRAGLRDALDSLPELLREAFLMHYVDEIPYETMAERLQSSVSALKMRVLRAREALARALQQQNVTPERPARLSVRRG